LEFTEPTTKEIMYKNIEVLLKQNDDNLYEENLQITV